MPGWLGGMQTSSALGCALQISEADRRRADDASNTPCTLKRKHARGALSGESSWAAIRQASRQGRMRNVQACQQANPTPR